MIPHRSSRHVTVFTLALLLAGAWAVAEELSPGEVVESNIIRHDANRWFNNEKADKRRPCQLSLLFFALFSKFYQKLDEGSSISRRKRFETE